MSSMDEAERRNDGLTGRSSMYPLEEVIASPEEALCTHWKKRWLHRKKLYANPLEEAMASPEEALCTHWKKR
jgi:hypothetical protein